MKSMKSKIAVALFSIAATAPAFAQYYDSRNNPISLKEGDVLQAGVGSSDAVIKDQFNAEIAEILGYLYPSPMLPRGSASSTVLTKQQFSCQYLSRPRTSKPNQCQWL